MKWQIKVNRTWLAAGALVATAAAWRVVNWHYGLAPNLEIVTASTLVAATFLGRRSAWMVPLGIMVASDVVIGNSPILLFTWSAFAVIGLAGLGLRRLTATPGALLATSAGAGLVASLFFFLYTNFGVWLLGGGAMYPQTWGGLLQCYTMGLPFYRTMLLGNLVLVPAYFAAALYGPAAVRWLAGRARLRHWGISS